MSNLRSIEAAKLESCGNFNVLIGKNNSGKSNLLAAILGFFNTFRSGEIIDLRPTFATEDDFHGRETRKPIEITCVLEIEGTVTSTIIDTITSEFPSIASGPTSASLAQ